MKREYIILSIVATLFLVTILSVSAITIPSSYQQRISKYLSGEAQTFFNGLAEDQKNLVYYMTKKEIQSCFQNTSKCLDKIKTYKLEPIEKEKKFKRRVLTYDIISSEEERMPLIKKRLEELQEKYKDSKEEFLDSKIDLKDCEKEGEKCPKENEKALEAAKVYISMIIDLTVEKLNLVSNKIKLSTELTDEEYNKANIDIINTINALAQLKGQISLALTKREAKEGVAKLKTTLQEIDHTRGLHLGLVEYAKLRNILGRASDLEEKFDCTLTGMEDEKTAVIKTKADEFSQLIGEVKEKMDTAQGLMERIVSLKINPQDIEKREISGLIVSLNSVLDEIRTGLKSAHKISLEISPLLKDANIELKSCKTEEYLVVKLKESEVKKEEKPKEEKKPETPKPTIINKTIDESATVKLRDLEMQTARNNIESLYSRLQSLRDLRKNKIALGYKVDSSVLSDLETADYNLAFASGLLENDDLEGGKEKITTITNTLDRVERLLKGTATSTSSSSTSHTSATNTSSLDTKSGLLAAISRSKAKADELQDELDDIYKDMDSLTSDDKDELETTYTELKDEVLAIRQGLGVRDFTVTRLKEGDKDFSAKLIYEKARYITYRDRLTAVEPKIDELKEEVDNAS